MYGFDVEIDLAEATRSFLQARTDTDESYLDPLPRFGISGHDLEHDEINLKRNLVVKQLNILLEIYDTNV